MRRLLTLSGFLSIFILCHTQTPVGTWTDHLVYNKCYNVAVGNDAIYASTGSSIIIYDKHYDELKKMTRINGLTETGISTIGWSEENKSLIVAYSTTNLDIVNNNLVYNLPDIFRKYIPGKKTINKIRTEGKYAYLACSFGIVVVDLIKKEIFDTWKPGSGIENAEVWDITFGNSKIFAATDQGVFEGDLSNPGLAYYANWNILNIMPDPSGKYTSLIYTGTKLFVNLKVPFSNGDYIYSYDASATLFSYTPGVFNTSFEPADNGFTVSSASSVKYYNKDGALIKNITSYGWGTPNIAQGIADNEDIWIADINSGLIEGKEMSLFAALTLPGPLSNDAYYIASHNGKTLICGGGTTPSWNNLWKPLKVSMHENNEWSGFSATNIRDAVRAFIDPKDEEHFFITTWGGGLLEYKNNIMVHQYKDSNSPLQTIIPGQAYVRVCGMAMDSDDNLWLTQTEVVGNIKILKPDGSWIVNPVTIDAPTIGDLIITRSGHKWIVLPRGFGLFVLDDNGTPEDFTDDKSKKILVKDVEEKTFSNIYSIAEDLDGNIWVGTDQGPLVYYNPEKVFDGDITAFRLKTPRNDGSGLADYILSTETVTTIAIDGANRKWLGTSASGAYLLSADGVQLVKQYNEQNSPILSNSVVSLSIDNKTGEVWFGTSKGVQSLRGDATLGKEVFSDVYTFPNPVREDYTGNVTITGLMRDSQIRITDISGNLVYQTISDGGQATWDLTTYNGKRVSTGVYLVFSASSDGTQSSVTKMLVIR